MQKRLLKKNLREFELHALQQGFSYIAGVDEVGRGCLAGPVVAACVILPWQEDFEGVDDSKKLSPGQREKMFPLIMARALAVGVGMVSPDEIDRINILQASLKAMRIAVEALKVKADFVLVDGKQSIPLLTLPQKAFPKADCLSVSVAAASIIAKVTRDRLMVQLAKQFPGFSFDRHKGYGTQKHMEELAKHGPTELHRRTFLS
ncbi:MAG: ribonuclease HII [Deltaproteobacteria bacterium]|nr:ribonuclease HII [Deltaproteobacteria bacterium]